MTIEKEKVLKDLGLCARCRQCRMVCEVPIATTMLPICPSGEFYKFDTYFASGRVTLAKKILLGKIDFDESILRAVYSCALCGSCKQQCPILNFDPMEATTVMRELAVEKGLADSIYPMPDTTPIECDCAACADSDTALFVGSQAQSDAETVKAIATALKKASVCFKPFAGADAGEYLLRKGDIKAFSAIKESNTAAFKAAGIKKLIAHDPMTYKVLKQDYVLDGIEVVFYLELLAGKVEAKVSGVKATYHDPSYLGRYLGVYDLPRAIITALGYELVEMVRTKENAMSSGAFPDYIPAVADLASKTIIGDAEQAGAQVLITVGRNAAVQLQKAAQQLGSAIVVKDLATLL
ncbi:(Fe-S)-binding protein [Pelotomaculum propionicicum]|uniref:4Fe-4S ferredoxin-type domain-containing protein n=1 Tax=Pelotomaculum propionicicum TaxID=258475 RepID=A0A4Y7RJP8_9FIRM|nr:(Fe-S)-binding protein [Pelotomaculum propionicicum]NLI12187.1 (Fe-S)-binding protein [Peptococcaceae bacterium]TEB09046.1 hypothetical protein Pmgp_03438 [Pelotomaculum propionicicum]